MGNISINAASNIGFYSKESGSSESLRKKLNEDKLKGYIPFFGTVNAVRKIHAFTKEENIQRLGKGYCAGAVARSAVELIPFAPWPLALVDLAVGGVRYAQNKLGK